MTLSTDVSFTLGIISFTSSIITFTVLSHYFRDFAGATFSGIVTEHGSFGWTMTCYSFSCIASVLLIVLLKLYRYMKHCIKQSSQIDDNQESRQILD